MSLRELVRSAPRHPIGGAPDPITFARDVCAWLDVELAVPLAPGPYTAIALAVDTVGDAYWAVPDAAIDGELRSALEEPWHRTFATEEITSAGPLWLLACTGLGDPHLYGWLGPHLGVSVERLAAAHRMWDAYAIEPGAFVGAAITHLYAARWAH